MTRNLKKIILGAILAIALGWVIEYTINFELELSDLKEVKGVIQKYPKFDSSRGSKYVEIVIDENTWRYQTSGIGYKALDIHSMKRDLAPGKPVTFLVSKSTGINEYLDEIVGIVDFYELKSNEKTYLSLADFNRGRKSNRLSGLLVWFIFFGGYIYDFWIKEKINSKEAN